MTPPPTDPHGGGGGGEDAPYMLLSLFPLPCVPAPLRRSSRFDLCVSTLCLFSAFLLHDGLQEEFYHALAIRAPIFLTSLDFIGCAFWGWVVCRATAPKTTAGAGATTASAAAASSHAVTPSHAKLARSLHDSNGKSANGADAHHVQIELVQVSAAGGTSSPITPLPKPADSATQRRLISRLPSSSSSSSPPAAHRPHGAAADDATPWTSYLAIGLLILLSNFLAIIALSYVEMPLKVILRSCKLIPTMIIGRLVMQKKYTAGHYAAAATLCLGVILFSLADVKQPLFADDAADAAARHRQQRTMFIGIALLVASVLVDALNPNIAEKFMKKNAAAAASAAATVSSSAAAAPQPPPPSMRRSQQPQSSDSDSDEENAPLLAAAQPTASSSSSSLQSQGSGSSGSHGGHHGAGARDPHSVNRFMFRTNVYVVPLLLLAVLVSGEVRLVASRVAIFPHVIPLFVLYCTASYAGIHSYTSMIARHGSVLTVGMATLRKICTIVLSYLFIGSTALVASSSASTTATNNSGAPMSAPQKHFGSQHLFPSLLILLGLLLSAWVDRKKGTDAPTATLASTASSSAATSAAVLARRGSSSGSAALTSRALSGASSSLQPQHGQSSTFGTEHASHEPSSRRDSQSSTGSAAAADGVGGLAQQQQHARALAAELGLETGGETECDTDVEQQLQSKSKPQRATTIMAKHAPHLSAQLARDMWGAHDDADDAI